MLRLYVTDPDTDVETEYTSLLRADKKFEVGSKVFNGEADQGDLLLDDPTGIIDWEVDFAAHRRVRIAEDASGSEKTIFVGRIASKEYERGHFRADRGREFSLTLADANADLSGIIVHNLVRGAETGRARALAILASHLNGASSTALNPASDIYGRDSTVIADTYVLASGDVSMPTETYDGTDPLEVLRAAAEFENKRMGVYIEDDASLALYYAPKDETSQLNCTLSVSDNEADITRDADGQITGDVYPPDWIAGPALHTDADEMISGALLVHSDGVTFDRRTAVEDVHDRWEEAVYSQKPKASGTAEIATLLDARELEQDRRQFAIRLPADKIHLVKAGMRIEVLRAVASTVDSPTFFRIVGVRYTYRAPGNIYNVIVTLETPIKLGSTWARPSPNPFASSNLFGFIPVGEGGQMLYWNGTETSSGGTHQYDERVFWDLPADTYSWGSDGTDPIKTDWYALDDTVAPNHGLEMRMYRTLQGGLGTPWQVAVISFDLTGFCDTTYGQAPITELVWELWASWIPPWIPPVASLADHFVFDRGYLVATDTITSWDQSGSVGLGGIPVNGVNGNWVQHVSRAYAVAPSPSKGMILHLRVTTDGDRYPSNSGGIEAVTYLLNFAGTAYAVAPDGAAVSPPSVTQYAELNSSPATSGTPGVQTAVDFDTFYDVNQNVIAVLQASTGLSYASGVFTAEEDGVWALNLGVSLVTNPGSTGTLLLATPDYGYSPTYHVLAAGNPAEWQVEKTFPMHAGDTFSLIQSSTGATVTQINGYATLVITRTAFSVA